MFSGIIESKGKIKSIKGKIFEIECDFVNELKIGQSIAHDGACLTVIKIITDRRDTPWRVSTNNKSSGSYQIEVMPETLDKTNLGNKEKGDYLNLERSLKIGDRLDGHIVQGHVDFVGMLKKIQKKENSRILTISFPKKYSNYFVEKGSVSLNGISLTIISAGNDFFTVGIIPHTWEITNLSNLKIGDKLNIETDIIGKYIVKIQKKSL